DGAVVTEANEKEIFPILTPEQVGRIAPFAREKTFEDGAILWDWGVRNNPMFVVVEGEIAIRSGADQLVTVHRPGAFSGDVDLLSGRREGESPGRHARSRAGSGAPPAARPDRRGAERDLPPCVHASPLRADDA